MAITPSEAFYPEYVALEELRDTLLGQTDDEAWNYPFKRTTREYHVRQTLGTVRELMHQLDELVKALPAADRWPDGAPT